MPASARSRERDGRRTCPQASSRNQPCQHLDFGCLTSRIREECISVVSSWPLYSNLLQQLQELIHLLMLTHRNHGADQRLYSRSAACSPRLCSLYQALPPHHLEKKYQRTSLLDKRLNLGFLSSKQYKTWSPLSSRCFWKTEIKEARTSCCSSVVNEPD